MKSLSARLLALTIIFVMLAEVLIFVPSVARYRSTYLQDRLEESRLAVLVLEAAPDGMVSQQVSENILRFLSAYSLATQRADSKMSIMDDMPPSVRDTVYVNEEGPLTMIIEAFQALVQPEDRILRVIGTARDDPSLRLELILDERPMVEAIQAFAVRIFFLSLAISFLTAIMVFFVLRRQLVRPLRRLSANMVRFHEAPEDHRRVIKPSSRQDELGVAERELADMQVKIRDALTQRRHLAALGIAVAKINHDLRGILSSALIVSDRLETSDDPEVQRIAPGLVDAIDRAVALCGRTLQYVGTDHPALDICDIDLHDAVETAGFALPNSAEVMNEIANPFMVQADRQQIVRIFTNLFRNSADAGATSVRVSLTSQDSQNFIEIDDDGPGLPPRALENLFKPFEGSGKAGGTGLGLSIARELAMAHGGDLTLKKSDAAGTVFLLTLPSKPTLEPV